MVRAPPDFRSCFRPFRLASSLLELKITFNSGLIIFMKCTHLTRALASTAATVLAGAALVACSSTDTGAGGGEGGGTDGTGGSDGAVDPTNIIATTSVWGDVASAVTGTEVESIIAGDSVDPHHFEPSAAELARIKQAGTLVANGGHYDAALYTVAEQDRIIHAIPLHAHGTAKADGDDGHSEHSHGEHSHGEHDDHDKTGHGKEGHDHGHAMTELPHSLDDLEHIWMAPSKVTEVAKQIEERAGGSAGDVDKRMGALQDRLNSFKHVHLAMTEPIAAGLIWETELHDITPEGYLLATLNEAEPAVGDVAQFLELIDSGALDFLVYNPQSTNGATQRLVMAAENNNIPVVEIRETPPEGVDFLDYLEQVIDDIAKVVDASEPRADADIAHPTD